MDRLCQLLTERKPDGVAVGCPVNMNGTRGPRAERAERLAAEADKKIPATENSDGDILDEDDDLKEMIKAWKSLSPSARAHAKAVIKALESSDDSEA